MPGIKVIAIYNVWDGEEHLNASVASLQPYVDDFLFITQIVSNKGETYHNGKRTAEEIASKIGGRIKEYKPNLSISAIQNEVNKRKLGLQLATGYSHYIFSDCDEVWRGIEPRPHATAAKIYTYYKTKDLTIGLDSYYVPAICPLPSDNGFAYFSLWQKAGFYCDPTRACKTNKIELVGEMHHYSWVRNDIERKMRNSSANLDDKRLLEEYNNAKEGYVFKHGTYRGRTLTRAFFTT